jgi:hypothetical protein
MKATGTIDKPITLENLSGRWAGLVIERKIEISPSFKLLLAYNDVKSYSVGKDTFNSLFSTSLWRSLVRYCPLCYGSHQTIFYKRVSDMTTFDAYDAMTCDFTSDDNVLNSDFGRSYRNIFHSFIKRTSHCFI